MQRRQLLMGIASGGLLAGASIPPAHAKDKMIMPWEWIDKQGEVADTDGTPLQFIPKKPKDPNPLRDELRKYPICPYCGMARGHEKWRRTRHLIHYSDDLVDATCSIHCAALSLGLNMDRVPKAIYAADAGATAEMPPLVKIEDLGYVISNKGVMGTMSKRRKWAYADPAKAKAAAAATGNGQVADFDEALLATYADMAEDTIAIRRRRAEKRRKASLKSS